ncbi:protein phosphatase 1G-like [Daphnia carinata]|uniref:protein phosphatase 1G-like n=1 Tax=Daphnia carinata TaxID=120202 RepID=UPI00257E61C8|nr:protein phosphatase 1G-like [Daphnia carinata]
MGAYLSEPIVEKISCNEKSDQLSYGASSMQGWRVSQEDAHNCILDFDTDTSLFAVYDGHGGHEVATYCAEHLPNFLKTLDSYKQGDISAALEEAYLGFDHQLTKEDVVKTLHCIAGNKTKDGSSEDDPDEMSELYEEATMSIEDLITRYGKRIKENVEGNEENSKGFSLDLISKAYAKGRKNNCGSETSVSKTEDTPAKTEDLRDSIGENASSENEVQEKPVDDNSEVNSAVKSQKDVTDVQIETNGKIHNGSDNHDSSHLKSNEVPISIKGKGVGKGLSNSIRKTVEKTPEELEIERREAEEISKRQERKRSLRSKSADELYKAIVTNDDDENSEEDGDDEEDEDFDGESSSDEDLAVEDDDDDDEWEDQEDEEEDEEEVEKKAKNFSMNLKEEPGSDSGCTAVLGLIRGNTLYVANAGDSRCVLSRKGRAVPLSADHKPEDEPERSRIERAGGVVTGDGRVNGGLNLSRAIGDHAYKQNSQLGPREQMITALPDIQSIDLEEGDDFIVLACDGIWNSKTNQQVVDFVRPRLSQSKTLSQICEELFDECLSPNTLGDGTGCDNMTAIIVRLDRFLPESKITISETAPTPSQPMKRQLTENSSPDTAEPECEGEMSHRSKKQRVEVAISNEDDTKAKDSELVS